MRLLDRLVCFALGVALAAAGLLAAVEAAAFALGSGPVLVPVERWLATLRATQVSDRGAQAAFGAATAAGLVLLVAQAWRRGARHVPLPGDDRIAWWLLRVGAERAIRGAVLHGAGARRARARLRPGLRTWRVTVDAETRPAVKPEALRPEMERHVHAALVRLGVPEGSAVRVRIRPGREPG